MAKSHSLVLLLIEVVEIVLALTLLYNLALKERFVILKVRSNEISHWNIVIYHCWKIALQSLDNSCISTEGFNNDIWGLLINRNCPLIIFHSCWKFLYLRNLIIMIFFDRRRLCIAHT